MTYFVFFLLNAYSEMYHHTSQGDAIHLRKKVIIIY